MSIHFTTSGPKNTLEKLSSWIPEIHKTAWKSGAKSGAIINLSQGYQVTYFSLQDVISGKLTHTNNTSRWRHLVVSESFAYGEIELDNTLEPYAFHQGEGKDGFNTAVELANKLNGNYEASVMEIPALRFIGLWLHNEIEDIVIPYPPNDTPLKNYQTVSIMDILDILQPIAKEVLKASEQYETIGG